MLHKAGDILVVGDGTSESRKHNCFAAGNLAGKPFITVGDARLTEDKVRNLATKDEITTVEANVSAGPIDELRNIKINNNVYSIPQGGGGSGEGTFTLVIQPIYEEYGDGEYGITGFSANKTPQQVYDEYIKVGKYINVLVYSYNEWYDEENNVTEVVDANYTPMYIAEMMFPGITEEPPLIHLAPLNQSFPGGDIWGRDDNTWGFIE